jgi:hypothetical protein
MMEIGNAGLLYGSASNVTEVGGFLVTYPIANYTVDGVPGKLPQAIQLDKTLT